MKYSQLFPKTLKQVPTGAESINHQLLVRGGFIDQLMAGSWTLLPLGFRVISKINQIIREELNKTGAQELSMPLLHPRNIWDQTGRWSDKDVQEIMYQFKDIHGKEFCLSFTHEEIVMDLLKKFIHSYKDLPVKIYQFSIKFRNEPRAKSGILRGREFLMNDLYSAHVSGEDMNEYYNEMKKVYLEIFKRIGLEARITEAAGGVFTSNHTHEFQVITPVGEDTIYYCESCDFTENKEIFEGEEGDKCHRCGNSVIKSAKSIEVGNIFPFGEEKYANKMGVTFKDENGKDQFVHFASYGIGPTRVMGTLVEVFHDERGIIWPESLAPYKVHLVGLDLETKEIMDKAEKVYKLLEANGVEILFDDRLGISAGEKFADADLIGISYRVVISKKTQDDKLELKKRSDKNTEFLSLEELLSKVKP
ncbi:MAG: aminoacyl--tRNA ligase-related protein [Candidatus Daviesbacteria bacterium]|nr:aminoacyl--tRNA ligase-related protein [Candidatus Daviesbacteria bacterium]